MSCPHFLGRTDGAGGVMASLLIIHATHFLNVCFHQRHVKATDNVYVEGARSSEQWVTGRSMNLTRDSDVFLRLELHQIHKLYFLSTQLLRMRIFPRRWITVVWVISKTRGTRITLPDPPRVPSPDSPRVPLPVTGEQTCLYARVFLCTPSQSTTEGQ